MSEREESARELAALLRIMGHPDRVRIINELSHDERDVKTLHTLLELPAPRVSQHLGLLRGYRIVEERREGRRRFYRLVRPQLAMWIRGGKEFVEERTCASLAPRASESS